MVSCRLSKLTHPLDAISPQVALILEMPMNAQPKSRTVKPNGDTIKRLRTEKGWRVEDLAKKMECSSDTVENAERGENVYMFTLNKFAEVLGVEYKLLITGDIPPPKQEKRFKLHLILEGDIETIDQSVQLANMIELLRRLLGTGDDIEPTDVKNGSVRITLEMSQEDIKTLLSLMMRLRKLQDEIRNGPVNLDVEDAELLELAWITDVVFPDDNEFDIKVLRGKSLSAYLNKPRPPSH